MRAARRTGFLAYPLEADLQLRDSAGIRPDLPTYVVQFGSTLDHTQPQSRTDKVEGVGAPMNHTRQALVGVTDPSGRASCNREPDTLRSRSLEATGVEANADGLLSAGEDSSIATSHVFVRSTPADMQASTAARKHLQVWTVREQGTFHDQWRQNGLSL